MNAKGLKNWTGAVLGPGPVVVLVIPPDPPPERSCRLVVVTEGGEVFTLPVELLSHFLHAHHPGHVISADRIPVLLAPAADGVNHPPVADELASAIDGLTDRWIDLRLLDLVVRVANGSSSFKARSESEIVSDYAHDPTRNSETYPDACASKDKSLGHRERSTLLVLAYGQLLRQFTQLEEDYRLPRYTETCLQELSDDEQQRLKDEVGRFVREVMGLRRRRAEVRQVDSVRSHEATPCEANFSSKREPAKADNWHPQSGGSGPPRSPREVDGPQLGMRTLIKSELVFEAVSTPTDNLGSRIARARIGDLRDSLHQRFRRASRMLHKSPEAREAFEWNGELVVLKKGHLKQNNALDRWLKALAARRVDRLNLMCDIPTTKGGGPTRNPEHWACWAACDRGLWAWRELTRVAELMRFTDDPSRRQGYEVVPFLRSLDPNLEAYRRLRVPIFHARPGHALLAGRVSDLRLRSFAAVGIKNGHFHRGASRLYNYIFARPDTIEEPLAEIAAELCDAERSRRTEPVASVQYGWIARYRAREGEKTGRNSDQENWTRLTNGLLHAAILGIPRHDREAYLECEHPNAAYPTSSTDNLIALLAHNIVPELSVCLEDRTIDIVLARLGRSARDAARAENPAEFPDTVSAHVRNKLKESGLAELGDTLGIGEEPPGSAEGILDPTAETRLDALRGRTLGGRLTPRDSHPIVLQREVLGSADEVMVEVAYGLIASGYRVLAVAGEEFLVEVPRRHADRCPDEVRRLATVSAGRLLGGHLAGGAVAVEGCDRW